LTRSEEGKEKGGKDWVLRVRCSARWWIISHRVVRFNLNCEIKQAIRATTKKSGGEHELEKSEFRTISPRVTQNRCVRMTWWNKEEFLPW